MKAKREPKEDDDDDDPEPEPRPDEARSVWLSSERLGITAKIDIVEGERVLVARRTAVAAVAVPIAARDGVPAGHLGVGELALALLRLFDGGRVLLGADALGVAVADLRGGGGRLFELQ